MKLGSSSSVIIITLAILPVLALAFIRPQRLPGYGGLQSIIRSDGDRPLGSTVVCFAAGGGSAGGGKHIKVEGANSYTVYKPAGWDREIYRAPDDVLFEWQELLCCLKFMEEKEVNAALLAPETREMMIGYAETIMSRGSPVNTIEGVQNAMKGRWKMAFTTEERYKILPPGTRVFVNIHKDGRLENIVKFKDKYWDSVVSTASYQLTPQGRLVFEFNANQVNVNNPFSKGSQWKLPLPPNVGNVGTAFTDISYMDGTMWIEKLRDNATGAIYYTIYEYQGPCEGEGQKVGSASRGTAAALERKEEEKGRGNEGSTQGSSSSSSSGTKSHISA